jgi:hypothetical protein
VESCDWDGALRWGGGAAGEGGVVVDPDGASAATRRASKH